MKSSPPPHISKTGHFASSIRRERLRNVQRNVQRISRGKRPKRLFFIAEYADLHHYYRRRCRVRVQQLRDRDSQALKLLRVLELKRVKQIISK